MTKYADRLKQLRRKQGLSQSQLSKLLGISKSCVNMYERGERVPRDDIKVRIAHYFGLTVEELFFATQ